MSGVRYGADCMGQSTTYLYLCHGKWPKVHSPAYTIKWRIAHLKSMSWKNGQKCVHLHAPPNGAPELAGWQLVPLLPRTAGSHCLAHQLAPQGRHCLLLQSRNGRRDCKLGTKLLRGRVNGDNVCTHKCREVHVKYLDGVLARQRGIEKLLWQKCGGWHNKHPINPCWIRHTIIFFFLCVRHASG